MKKLIFLLLLHVGGEYVMSQNIGIGTNMPKARLHVVDSSVLFSAEGTVPQQPGNPPISGAGRRLMWYASKAAFRVGRVYSDRWDKDSIGSYSIAGGYDAAAKGSYSAAFGAEVTASGLAAVAMGQSTLASGDGSFAMGFNNKASNYNAVSFGSSSEASGMESFSAGNQARATGINSQAHGYKVIASGDYSMAFGSSNSTNGFTGAFVMADHSTTDVMWSGASNSFYARFAGGYRFFTNTALSTGAYLAPNQNAWSTISSVYLKENFEPVDGESFLQKIKAMQLTSWNYKGQDKTTLRHYGPMAQDFYAAFGRDRIGTIGEETSINQADFDGVNLVAIQALEKRTASQAETIHALLLQVESLTNKLEKLLRENQ